MRKSDRPANALLISIGWTPENVHFCTVFLFLFVSVLEAIYIIGILECHGKRVAIYIGFSTFQDECSSIRKLWVISRFPRQRTINGD